MNSPDANDSLAKLYLRPGEMFCPFIAAFANQQMYKHANLDSQKKQLIVKLILRILLKFTPQN